MNNLTETPIVYFIIISMSTISKVLSKRVIILDQIIWICGGFVFLQLLSILDVFLHKTRS